MYMCALRYRRNLDSQVILKYKKKIKLRDFQFHEKNSSKFSSLINSFFTPQNPYSVIAGKTTQRKKMINQLPKFKT